MVKTSLAYDGKKVYRVYRTEDVDGRCNVDEASVGFWTRWPLFGPNTMLRRQYVLLLMAMSASNCSHFLYLQSIKGMLPEYEPQALLTYRLGFWYSGIAARNFVSY